MIPTFLLLRICVHGRSLWELGEKGVARRLCRTTQTLTWANGDFVVTCLVQTVPSDEGGLYLWLGVLTSSIVACDRSLGFFVSPPSFSPPILSTISC